MNQSIPQIETTTASPASATSSASSSPNGAQNIVVSAISQHQIGLRNNQSQANLAIEQVKGKVSLSTPYQAQLLHAKINNENTQTILRLFEGSAQHSVSVPSKAIEHLMNVSQRHLRYEYASSPNVTHEAKVLLNAVKGNRLVVDSGGQLTTLVRQGSSPTISSQHTLRLAFNQAEPKQFYIIHHSGQREPISVPSTEVKNLLNSLKSHQTNTQLTLPVSVVQNNKGTINIKLGDNLLTAKLVGQQQLSQTKNQFLLTFSATQHSTPFSLTDANGVSSPLQTNKSDNIKLLTAFLQQQGTLKISSSALLSLLQQHSSLNEGTRQQLMAQPWVEIKISSDGQLVASLQKQKLTAEIILKSGQNNTLEGLKLPSSEQPLSVNRPLNSNATIDPVSITKLLNQLKISPLNSAEQLNAIQTALSSTKLAEQQGLHTALLNIAQQLKQGTPSGQSNDHQLLQQLMVAPSHNLLPLTQSNQISSPLLSGLVQMLQVALGTRIQASDQASTNNKSNLLTKLISGSSVSTNEVKTGVNSAVQKQLIKTATQVLQNHQFSKLESAEKQLKGIEQIHYQIPYQDVGEVKQAEIMIQREQPNQSSENEQQKQWRLSMKLEIGQWGEMLAKVKMAEQDVSINLYAENETTVQHIRRQLPLLVDRLTSLGMSVKEHNCQQGKVPQSLQKTNYHLFEAYA